MHFPLPGLWVSASLCQSIQQAGNEFISPNSLLSGNTNPCLLIRPGSKLLWLSWPPDSLSPVPLVTKPISCVFQSVRSLQLSSSDLTNRTLGL